MSEATLTAKMHFPPALEAEIKGSESNPILERILEAHAVAQAYADQLPDPDFAKAVRSKLSRSNVKGSRLEGVHNADDVIVMLQSVTGWKEVTTSLVDKQITCFQGELSDAYKGKAYSAYASVREIAHKFGAAGLSTIQAKTGYQKDDEFYFCTLLRFPTETITVQVKTDPLGNEHLHQWFAGPELTSLLRKDDGDTFVRCGVIIPQVQEQKAKHGFARREARNHTA